MKIFFLFLQPNSASFQFLITHLSLLFTTHPLLIRSLSSASYVQNQSFWEIASRQRWRVRIGFSCWAINRTAVSAICYQYRVYLSVDLEYVITMPNMYARGILFGKMVLELGDTCTAKNDANGLSCDLEFKTKVHAFTPSSRISGQNG